MNSNKTINVISLKKSEALALIYSGKSKTFVRNRLNIKAKRLNKWLYDDMKKWLKNEKITVREKALHMHFYKIPKEDICKRLFITEFQLKNWVHTVYKHLDIDPIIKTYKKPLNARQNGYSRWNDSIFNSCCTIKNIQ